MLVTLRKAPGKIVAPDQTSSAEAGSVTSETLLADAAERLRRSNENFKGNREPRAGENGANGDVAAEPTQVFLDEGGSGAAQDARSGVADREQALGTSDAARSSATNESTDVPE